MEYCDNSMIKSYQTITKSDSLASVYQTKWLQVIITTSALSSHNTSRRALVPKTQWALMLVGFH